MLGTTRAKLDVSSAYHMNYKHSQITRRQKEGIGQHGPMARHQHSCFAHGGHIRCEAGTCTNRCKVRACMTSCLPTAPLHATSHSCILHLHVHQSMELKAHTHSINCTVASKKLAIGTRGNGLSIEFAG